MGDEESDLEEVQKIDLRSQYLLFNFEVRTEDNVRLQLEGTIFWQVMDAEIMIKKTRDPRGDVWHHSRNLLIQAVSKSDLKTFMDSFNSLVEEAFLQDDPAFYTERGVKVHSMEVTGYQCVDEETAVVLQEIIRETTNRINRLERQRSEDEVADLKLKSEITLEKSRTELLQQKAENDKLQSQMEGEAHGLKLAKSAEKFMSALNETGMDLETRLDLYKLHQELSSKNETTANLASGTAMLFVTPNDVYLEKSEL